MEFVKQLQPVDLRLDASHIKTNLCCSDTNKHTHTFVYLCTNLVSLKRKGGMLHTHKARWRGDRKFAHKLRFSDKQLMLLWTIPSQKHNTNATLEAKHRNQLITVVCNLVGGVEVNGRGLGSMMAQVDGSMFENFTLKYQP